ncbi:hypothetical protein KPL76_10290 [Subtercola sp. PAMC28395]|uniref:hypothetical protein n=1 Tax=Subtercola sp. PAMC28395 TaxID=2846775 RepID=UPI001C0D04EB|nr:hypothetical protein [Subtercola sp. PAMC28395]QWT23135.1 hypothetical protein KPL76_10290 [Subtercola sp. PAMC28395]
MVESAAGAGSGARGVYNASGGVVQAGVQTRSSADQRIVGLRLGSRTFAWAIMTAAWRGDNPGTGHGSPIFVDLVSVDLVSVELLSVELLNVDLLSVELACVELTRFVLTRVELTNSVVRILC